MGIEEVQVGSLVIKTKKPAGLTKLRVGNVTIRPGDVVVTKDNSYPMRITAIRRVLSDKPSILTRQIDAGPELKMACSDLMCPIQHFENCTVLTQADVDRWFGNTKRLSDGWYKISDRFGFSRVLVKDGKPVTIERQVGHGWSSSMKFLAEEAGRLTGYDIRMTGRYTDPNKSLMAVKTATRREPPRI
jgi:uncharacterized protein YfiM (DUF2279 family)